MKTLHMLTVVAMASLAAPIAAQAQPAHAAAGCPPGLAKKSPACVPPGQAKKSGAVYGIGDRVDRDIVIIDRDRFGLPPLAEGEAYVRVGDQVLRLDRDERLVLDVLDVVLN